VGGIKIYGHLWLTDKTIICFQNPGEMHHNRILWRGILHSMQLSAHFLLVPLILLLSVSGSPAQVLSFHDAYHDKHSSESSRHEQFHLAKNEVIETRNYDFTGIPSDLILPCGTEIPEWPVGPSTLDVEGVPLEITEHQSVQFTPCGGKEYIRNWVVKEEGKRITLGSQKISFLDESAPQIRVPSDIIVNTTDAIPLPYYEATDHGCSTFEVFFEEKEIESTDSELQVLRIWTAIDACGNTSSAKQIVTVIEDGTPDSGQFKE